MLKRLTKMKARNIMTTANTTAGVTTTSTVVAATKADKARTIFKEAYSMSPVPQRKDIINRLVIEAGLTKAGAATYLQNMKTKAGLVVSRTTSVPATA